MALSLLGDGLQDNDHYLNQLKKSHKIKSFYLSIFLPMKLISSILGIDKEAEGVNKPELRIKLVDATSQGISRLQHCRTQYLVELLNQHSGFR